MPRLRAPWEARAFAPAVALRQLGVLTAREWAAAPGEALQRAQAAGDPDTGETCYRHWLAALARLVAARGLTDAATLARYRPAWQYAAALTPHGLAEALKAGQVGVTPRCPRACNKPGTVPEW